MANEITINSSLRVQKGTIDIRRRTVAAGLKATMTGSSYSCNVQNIPVATTGTALVIAAGVATQGWSFFQNNDTTNYVEIGVQSTAGTIFLPCFRLNAGEGIAARLATGAAVFAKANTATVNLEHTVISN